MFGGMPRASTKTTEEEVKKAPRKRAIRRVVTKDDEAPAPRRTRAPRKVVSDDVEEDASPRRAPTVFAKEKAESSRKRKSLLVGIGVLLVVTAVSAWIGSTDSGQINVSAKIEEESQRQPQANIDVENQEGGTTVPVQNTPPPPEAISGLQGRGVGTAPVNQPAPVTEEATSTPEVATSTDAVVATTEETEENTETDAVE